MGAENLYIYTTPYSLVNQFHMKSAVFKSADYKCDIDFLQQLIKRLTF